MCHEGGKWEYSPPTPVPTHTLCVSRSDNRQSVSIGDLLSDAPLRGTVDTKCLVSDFCWFSEFVAEDTFNDQGQCRSDQHQAGQVEVTQEGLQERRRCEPEVPGVTVTLGLVSTDAFSSPGFATALGP